MGPRGIAQWLEHNLSMCRVQSSSLSAVLFHFLFLLCLVIFILANYLIKWLLLHVLFNHFLISIVVSYFFDFNKFHNNFIP